ncbi:ribonuclease H protein [Trifolium medium]|uniref:Ribonuclease H protein n=1 Tax=Trifolium medium TaxID=97028 RepID=A0A392P093_9FABA|nr:ribonuclease H protein [Trifolium medium]
MKDEQFVHPISRTQIMIGWTAPKEGWVKINTGGARKEDGYAGCSGLIRGCDKEWLGGFSKQLVQCLAYVAELWGIFEGLKLARRLGFHKVEVCFDSRVVYNNIINGMNGNVVTPCLVCL